MHLLLQIRAANDTAVATALDCDDASTVGEVADLVVQRLRLRVPSGPSLVVVGRAHRPLARAERMSEAGIRSGDLVTVQAEDPATAERVRGDALASAPAVLVVRRAEGGGSFGTRRYPLRLGANVLGRDPSAAVVLNDPGVSRRHATVYVRDIVEVDDNASSNGVWVGGQRIQQTTRVEPGTEWSLGDLVVHVERSGQAVDLLTGLDHLPFNPPPRVAARYEGRPFVVPAPPEKPARTPLPTSAMLLPLVLLAVLVGSGQKLEAMTLAFVVVSPLLVVGTVIESWVAARKDHRVAVEEHKVDVDEVIERLVKAQRTEVERRTAEAPAAAECDVIARTLSGRLWERRPDHVDLLELSVGMGQTPTRSTLTVEPGGSRRPARRLRDLPRQYARVGPVPATASFAVSGGIGVAGAGPAADLARALLVQAVSLHSPADLSVAAIVGPGSAATWEWLKWLPHSRRKSFPVDVHPLASNPDAAVSLIEALDAHIAASPTDDRDAVPSKRVLLFIDDADLPVERARLMHLLRHGPAAGVHVLWLSGDYNRLPSTSGASVVVNADGIATLGEAATGVVLRDLVADRASIEVATATAMALCPVVDVSRSTAVDEEPPERISLPVALEDVAILTDAGRIRDRWAEGATESSGLPVIIGHRGRTPLLVDIRRDGPHALIAGTTGAGKSELLQTLLASLATTHSPQRLTFLLVDYKGGAAFKDCKLLPHTVGFVTDLDKHEVHRALISLNAELTYRERLLNKYDAKDLVEMEEKGYAETPPSLMIVVDEFAALAKEVPEFVDGVVNVAQRGRSLGLHLLLATQRPAGVITDNIRANTNLRIALRVSDVEDSMDVIGLPLAAHLSRSIPGRAVAKVGPGEIVPFQSAYVGATTAPGELSSRLDLAAFQFAGTAPLATGPEAEVPHPDGATFLPGSAPLAAAGPDAAAPAGPAVPETDLERIVATTNAAVELLQLPAPRKPWLDPLPALVDLLDPERFGDDGRSPDAGKVLIGRIDHPVEQAQHDAILDVAQDGSVLVFGASRSGKTALLRTIAVSVGRNRAEEPVHVYGLDFTGRGLAMLEALPHVGSVISGEDEERVARLLRTLREIQRERAALFHEAGGVTDIEEYRRAVPDSTLPRIYVLIDGYAAFNQQYDVSMDDLPEQVERLIAEGRSAGIHFIIANDLRVGVPLKVFGGISTRVVLRMATEDEYSNFGLSADAIPTTAPPGRGYLNNDEVQIALVGDGFTGEEQVEAIQRAAVELAHVVPAPPIARLETEIALSSLPRSTTPGRPVVGRSGVTLEPVVVNVADQHTLVIGPMRSGRTSALLTLVTGAPVDAWAQRVVLSPRASFLTSAPGLWTDVGLAVSGATEVVQRLIDERTSGSDEPAAPLLVVIDDLFELNGDFDLEAALEQLMGLSRDLPIRIVAAMDLDAANRNSGAQIFVDLRAAKHGLLLQPDGGDGDLLGAQFRVANSSLMPTGRGYLIVRGTPELVQLADPMA